MREFVITDYSAIEARVISWFATEKWRLDVFATHGKIYEATGARMFRVPIEQVTKGSKYRDAAKVAELACGFQGGIDALIKMAISQNIELPDDDLQLIIDNWRAANPNIVRLWKGMQKAAMLSIATGRKVMLTEVVDSNGDGLPFVKKDRGVYFEYINKCLLMTLPSGRKLVYYNASLEEGKYGKKIVYWNMDQTTKQWRKVDTYGGKLTENLVQATARDVLANGLLNLDSVGFIIPAHVHDEAIIECEASPNNLERINRLMIKPAPWMRELPMNAEGFTNSYYKKEM